MGELPRFYEFGDDSFYYVFPSTGVPLSGDFFLDMILATLPPELRSEGEVRWGEIANRIKVDDLLRHYWEIADELVQNLASKTRDRQEKADVKILAHAMASDFASMSRNWVSTNRGSIDILRTQALLACLGGLEENQRLAIASYFTRKTNWVDRAHDLGTKTEVLVKAYIAALRVLADNPMIVRYFGINSGVYDEIYDGFKSSNGANIQPIIDAASQNPAMLRDDFKLPIMTYEEYARNGKLMYLRGGYDKLMADLNMYYVAAFLHACGETYEAISTTIQRHFPHGGMSGQWFTGGRANGSFPVYMQRFEKFMRDNPRACSIEDAWKIADNALGNLIAVLFLYSGRLSGVIAGSKREFSHKIPMSAINKLMDHSRSAIFMVEGEPKDESTTNFFVIRNQIIARVLECIAYDSGKTGEILDSLPEKTKRDLLFYYLYNLRSNSQSEKLVQRVRRESVKVPFLRWLEKEIRERNLARGVFLSLGSDAVLEIIGCDFGTLQSVLYGAEIESEGDILAFLNLY